MRILFVITVSVLWFGMFNSCQNNTINESRRTITFSSKDSLRLNQLLDSLSNTTITSTDSLHSFSKFILEQFKSDYGAINIRIAHVFFSHSNYLLAQYHFQAAADYYRSRGELEKNAEQITNVGVTKEISGDYTDAVEDYLYALNIFDSLNIPLKQSYAYNNLGIVYQKIGNYTDALAYYKRSLNIASQLHKQLLEASRNNNIATLYEEDFKNIDSAFYYYRKAYQIYKTKSELENVAVIENNMGYLYFEKHQLEPADSLYNKALGIASEHKYFNVSCSIYRNKSELQLAQNHLKEAEFMANTALNLAQKHNLKEPELKVLKVLKDIYESMNEYRKANQVIKKYYELKNELSGVDEQNKINGLVLKYHLKEKEHLIQVLELQSDIQNRKLWQLWLLIAALIFLLGGLYLMYRLQRKNSKIQILQMQRDISDYISLIEEIKEDKTKISDTDADANVKSQMNKKKILDNLKTFNLSEREEDVLLLIAQGYKNAEIAEKLFLSVNTIKTHTKNIFIKLDVRNRIEASRKAQMF